MKKILVIIGTIINISVVMAQDRDVSLLLLQSNDQDINIVYANDSNYFEIFTKEKSYFDDFYFLGRYSDKQQNIVIFEEYSSPAGMKRLYIFSIDDKFFFKTRSFNEISIPLIQTIDTDEKTLQSVSIDQKDCGKFESSKLETIGGITEKNKLKTIEKYKILNKIKL